MVQVIECVGHPRDLGQAQGVALRRAVAQKAEDEGLPLSRSRWPSLHPYVKGPVRGGGSFREMIRHYTHLAERVDGLSRGADLPIDTVFSLQDEDPAAAQGSLTLLASGLESVPGPVLVRGLSGPDWVVRKSRPEVGFASIELTRPWSVSSVAGINEASLAACLIPDRLPKDGKTSTQPPAPLLVQECLQRFQDVEAGIDWCSHRPAFGSVRLLLADASGSRALIRFEGPDTQVSRDLADVQALGASGSQVESLLESVAQTKAMDQALLSEALIKESAQAYVRLACDGPLFEVQSVTGPEESLCLELNSPED